jgi:hypothetical protein
VQRRNATRTPKVGAHGDGRGQRIDEQSEPRVRHTGWAQAPAFTLEARCPRQVQLRPPVTAYVFREERKKEPAHHVLMSFF